MFGRVATPQRQPPAENIEFASNNVVVLKGLDKKSYPKYMVAVLNKPDNFVYGETLDEMQTVLADNNAEGIYYPGNNQQRHHQLLYHEHYELHRYQSSKVFRDGS